MNTQTHVIIGAALFGRGLPKRSWIAALGGLIPDLPMLLVTFGLMLYGVPGPIIFGVLYWQDWWQITNAIGHNFWAWGGLVLLGLVMRDRLRASAQSFDRWTLVSVFAGSALLHTAIDFLLHREDAHMSFWPVTRWKFMSPASYWDQAHYGSYVSAFEAGLGLVLAVILFRQFRSRLVRAALSRPCCSISVCPPISWVACIEGATEFWPQSVLIG